jgi:hypothetical protein
VLVVQRPYLEQTTAKYRVLHCVQDDDVEQTTAKATTKQATANEQRQMRGSFTTFRMTTSEWTVLVDDSVAVAAEHSFRMTTSEWTVLVDDSVAMAAEHSFRMTIS